MRFPAYSLIALALWGRLIACRRLSGGALVASMLLGGTGGFACLSGFLQLLPQAAGVRSAPVQQVAIIKVDAATKLGPYKPIISYFSYFGYDEPNYTYMKYGPKLVGELAALSYVPVYIRAHHLLCTGDGTAALKWGSTNAYTEDSSGKPVYDWKIVDRIIDTYIQAHTEPFVEIGFMPEALSVKPQPYSRNWPKPDDGQGWSYPPKDYAKWEELVRQWVLHSVERYGKPEVETWYWEVWNEPDISYPTSTATDRSPLDRAMRLHPSRTSDGNCCADAS